MMLYLLMFAAVTGGLGYLAYKRSKVETRIYSKLAAISLFFISIFFLYQFTYYVQLGVDIANFSNAGTGITYSGNNTTVFLSSTDIQVGEYFAMQRANRGVIEIFSGIIPILAILLGGYLLWYYIETGLIGREEDRVT